MNISIFGLGYVGCVSIGCLAEFGHNMIGVDINQSKVDLVNTGKPTIYEKDLSDLFLKAYQHNKISATKDSKLAVQESELSYITVGTPVSESGDGHLTLNQVFHVAQEIGVALKSKTKFHVVVIRSTVLPGTNKKVAEIINEHSGKKEGVDFAVVSNPEFLREGAAVYDFFNPPVTVIGTNSSKALKIMSTIYKEIPARIEVTDIEIAEIIKYVNNTWHALKVTFANEIGNICKKIDIDSHKLMDLFLMDTKLNISEKYLRPGFAYGGSCLPKDLSGLKAIARDNFLISPVIESISHSNENHIAEAIKAIESKKKKKLGFIGLSFKPDTDDLRYSPIVRLAEYFLGKGYEIKIYDKYLKLSAIFGANKEYVNQHIPHLSKLMVSSSQEAINKSEVIILFHKLEDIEKTINNNSDRYFLDLSRLTDKKFDNYEGICW